MVPPRPPEAPDPKTLAGALDRATDVGADAARVGFDWASATDVIPKLREEIEEIAEALAAGHTADAARELGDLLFAACNLARHLGADPAAALHAACDEFGRRFEHMDRTATARGTSLDRLSPAELEALWGGAKIALRAEDRAGSGRPGDAG